MKLILLLIYLLWYGTQLHAQFPQIAESAEFPEPEDGFGKIVQLKNGNTMFIHITNKNGIDIKLFNQSRKLTAENHITASFERLKESKVEGVFEIDNDVVTLVSKVEADEALLYRLIFDGNTGKLKEDKKLESTTVNKKHPEIRNGWSTYFHSRRFMFRKDLNSVNYAIAVANKLTPSKTEEMESFEVIVFGEGHVEKSRHHITSPTSQFNYIQYVDMIFLDNSNISLLVAPYNASSRGVIDNDVFIATLTVGDAKPKFQELPFLKTSKIAAAILQVNPSTGKLIILTAARDQERNSKDVYKQYYFVSIAILESTSLKLEKNLEPYPRSISEKSIELFGKKHAFSGLPQNIYFNADGSFVVIFEEIINYGPINLWSELINMAVVTFDKNGKQGDSYYLPKKQIYMDWITAFYQADQENAATAFGWANQYKSFAYLNGKEKSYLLLNDIPENEKTFLKGKITAIRDVTECNTYYYPMSGKDLFPKRGLLFDNSSDRNNKLGTCALSSYDSEKNIFVILKLTDGGKNKKAKLIWLQPN